MSEDPKAGPDGAEQAVPAAAADPGVAADTAASPGPADAAEPNETAAEMSVAELQVALEQARTEASEAVDRALRAQAEAENIRRRAAQEVDKARKFALEKFAGDLLPVVDSLDKAVQTFDAAASADQPDPAALAALGDGVRLSLKLFLDTLDKSGVAQVDPHGEPFDPQFHEAMAMVPNPAMEPNSVMDVVQKGYTLNGRLLRAAMVVVTKAPDAGIDTTV